MLRHTESAFERLRHMWCVTNLCLLLCTAVVIMAMSKLKWCVTEIATCPICLDDFVEPKSLPCVHSFCLKCIEEHCKDKLPGQSVDCPVCRMECKLPENGIPGLPHNFFLKNLVDAKKNTGEDDRVVCDVCIKVNADDLDIVPAATICCVDCNQKLCKRCSLPHKMWSGGPHELRELADIGKTELLQQHRSRCEKHELKFIELYCFDCKADLCMKCFAVGHTQHKCAEIEQVATEFSKCIDTDIKQVRQRLYEFTAAMTKAEEESAKFHASVEKVEKEIVQKGEKLKRLVDKHVDELQQQLRQLQAVTDKDTGVQKDSLLLALLAMESYTEYAVELKNKGSHSDVIMAADELHSRASKLLQTYVIPVDCSAPAVAFTASHIVDDLVQTGKNIIGSIGANDLTGIFYVICSIAAFHCELVFMRS